MVKIKTLSEYSVKCPKCQENLTFDEINKAHYCGKCVKFWDLDQISSVTDHYEICGDSGKEILQELKEIKEILNKLLKCWQQ